MNNTRLFFKDLLTQRRFWKKIKFSIELFLKNGEKFQNDVVLAWKDGRDKNLKYDLVMKSVVIDHVHTLYMFSFPEGYTEEEIGTHWCGFITGRKTEKYFTATEIVKGILAISEWGENYHGNMGHEVDDIDLIMKNIADDWRSPDHVDIDDVIVKVLQEHEQEIKQKRREKIKRMLRLDGEA